MGQLSRFFVWEKSIFPYEQIVYWRKNLFLLPSGQVEKNFIDEISRLMIDWIHESPLKNMAFKAIMVLFRLLWQKPSRKSKSKNHFKSLENQMELWHVEEIMELVKEIETTQKDLRISNTPSTITKISKKFTREMSRGKSIMWWYWWRWYSFIKWSNLKSDEVKTPTW